MNSPIPGQPQAGLIDDRILPVLPREVHITEAEGGWIVGTNWPYLERSKQVVVTRFDDLVSIIKEAISGE